MRGVRTELDHAADLALDTKTLYANGASGTVPGQARMSGSGAVGLLYCC